MTDRHVTVSRMAGFRGWYHVIGVNDEQRYAMIAQYGNGRVRYASLDNLTPYTGDDVADCPLCAVEAHRAAVTEADRTVAEQVAADLDTPATVCQPVTGYEGPGYGWDCRTCDASSVEQYGDRDRAEQAALEHAAETAPALAGPGAGSLCVGILHGCLNNAEPGEIACASCLAGGDPVEAILDPVPDVA